jgi:hypothetical protein
MVIDIYNQRFGVNIVGTSNSIHLFGHTVGGSVRNDIMKIMIKVDTLPGISDVSG